MLSSLYNSLVGSNSSSAPSSTPSTPPPSSSVPSPSSSSQPATAFPDPSELKSTFYQKLVAKGKHSTERLEKIRLEAIKDFPPKEPIPEECCGEACGLECVTTVWWEEEKTWRDLHPEWRSIKARLAAEEEDLRIAREEEEALNGGGAGEPEVEIEIDREETEDEVMDRITRGWKG